MGYEYKIGAILKKYGYEVHSGRASMCPFCGHKHLFVDDKEGVFCCWYNGCDKKGGVKEFAMAFYGEVLGQPVSTPKEALQMLDDDLGVQYIKYVQNSSYSNTTSSLNPIAPVEHRNIVYRKMQKILPLKEADLNSLLARGYTEAQIRSFGYVSLPVSKDERKLCARKLLEAGISLKNIGGFEMVDGDYQVADFGFYLRKRGFGLANESDKNLLAFLVPSYDMHGNLQYFQIAWDKRISGKLGKDEYAKYTVFSTPKRHGGGKIKSDAGYIGYYKKNDKGLLIPDLRGKTTIPVIEGHLKAALYFELINRKEPCISQTGTSNYKALRKFLVELKNFCPEIEQVDDCYDMDRFKNENVQKGSDRLKEICDELGLRYHMRTWDARYKGIDDYALAWRQHKI